jgi:hypothetical protein
LREFSQAGAFHVAPLRRFGLERFCAKYAFVQKKMPSFREKTAIKIFGVGKLENPTSKILCLVLWSRRAVSVPCSFLVRTIRCGCLCASIQGLVSRDLFYKLKASREQYGIPDTLYNCLPACGHDIFRAKEFI